MHSYQLLSCPPCGHGCLSAGLASNGPCIWNRTWAYILLGSSLPLNPHHHHCPTSLLKQAGPSAGGQISPAAVGASQGWGLSGSKRGSFSSCTLANGNQIFECDVLEVTKKMTRVVSLVINIDQVWTENSPLRLVKANLLVMNQTWVKHELARQQAPPTPSVHNLLSLYPLNRWIV